MVATDNCKVCGGLTNAVWNFPELRRYENCERCGHMRIRVLLPTGSDHEVPDEFRMELLLFLETRDDLFRLLRRLKEAE